MSERRRDHLTLAEELAEAEMWLEDAKVEVDIARANHRAMLARYRKLRDMVRDTREKLILDQHYEGGRSLRSIADEMGISHEYVRQIRNKGLRRAKAAG